MPRNVLAIIGAQYGSEGKGVITNWLADRYGMHVRVGGPNAGHSFYSHGRVWKQQQVPCGWTNSTAVLVIGRGALVDMQQLRKEIKEIEQVDPFITERLVIDALAGVVLPEHAKEAGGTEGEAHKRYGSTGKGVGVARTARLTRDPKKFKLVKDVIPDDLHHIMEYDTPSLVNNFTGNVLLEGTQGSGLSLWHGPWPYVSNHDTNAAQMLADVGLPPAALTQVLLVARTFPIRVAGTSGPMKMGAVDHAAGEITWDDLSARLGKKVVERTTVTDKVRRIGMWDDLIFERAIMLNRPTSIALTFIDYLSPDDEGKTAFNDLSTRSKDFVHYVERMARVPVSLIGTGGHGWNVIERGKI